MLYASYFQGYWLDVILKDQYLCGKIQGTDTMIIALTMKELIEKFKQSVLFLIKNKKYIV